MLCKDCANERKENLFSVSRVQPMLCKGTLFYLLKPILVTLQSPLPVTSTPSTAYKTRPFSTRKQAFYDL